MPTQLPGEIVNGYLKAYQDGNIYTDKWVLKNGNLISESNGQIHIQTLESAGQQVADANITISDHLVMSDLNPNEVGLGSNEWIGLNVGKNLTLQNDAKISANLSNDYLSINNIRFNSEHTLVKALTLNDLRHDKEIIFNLEGNDVDITTEIRDNKIVFAFNSGSDDSQSGGQGKPNSPIDEILNTPVGNEFLGQNLGSINNEILTSIIEHNYKGELTYQDVAIKDALSMSNTQNGVHALNKIVGRQLKQLAKKVCFDQYVISSIHD